MATNSNRRMYLVEMTESEFTAWTQSHPNRQARQAYTYDPVKGKEYRAKAQAKLAEMKEIYEMYKTSKGGVPLPKPPEPAKTI